MVGTGNGLFLLALATHPNVRKKEEQQYIIIDICITVDSLERENLVKVGARHNTKLVDKVCVVGREDGHVVASLIPHTAVAQVQLNVPA